MDQLSVGSKVVLLREVMGAKVGSIGFVYGTYPDFDSKGEVGVDVIFSNGTYCGFSKADQELCFEDLGIDSRFQMYNFSNIGVLSKDFRNHYWSFNE